MDESTDSLPESNMPDQSSLNPRSPAVSPKREATQPEKELMEQVASLDKEMQSLNQDFKKSSVQKLQLLEEMGKNFYNLHNILQAYNNLSRSDYRSFTQKLSDISSVCGSIGHIVSANKENDHRNLEPHQTVSILGKCQVFQNTISTLSYKLDTKPYRPLRKNLEALINTAFDLAVTARTYLSNTMYSNEEVKNDVENITSRAKAGIKVYS